MQYYVYILANGYHTTLYIGVTNSLRRRIHEHKEHIDPMSFTSRYHVDNLVYYEIFSDSLTAIEREKQLKSWIRKRKDQLIESVNPMWDDLYSSIV